MTEIWKDIDGFDGRYQISDKGRVRSMRRGGWIVKKPSIQSGYFVANLSLNNRNIRRMIHQLVARAFIGPPPKDRTSVNHKDGRKTNNTPENLEWVTRAENMKHAWRTGLCRPTKLSAEQVETIRACGGLDTHIAKRFGVSQVLVTKIRAGKVWNSESHMQQYKEHFINVPDPNE